MIKKALYILFITFQVNAQVDLNFDKTYVECEDKWIAFKANEDGFYSFGFIYIDSQAGLTFNSEGVFKPVGDGKFEIEKITNSNIKVRLQPNNVKVAIIPKDLFVDLKIEETPTWLKHYKNDLDTAKRNYRWGYMYNGWNECEKALTYLLKAKELEPEYEGLAVEIAFSYNCLGDYDNAIEILDNEIKNKPTDAYVNKEYIYSITKTDNITKAAKQFHKSVNIIKTDIYNAENCFNIMQAYYYKKDKKNFKKWYKELKKWPNNNEQIDKYVKIMQKDLN